MSINVILLQKLQNKTEEVVLDCCVPYVVAVSSSSVGMESSCLVHVIDDGNGDTNAEVCSTVVSHETEPESDILSLDNSSARRCAGDERRDDNSNICAADDVTCRENKLDDKLPRFLHYLISV